MLAIFVIAARAGTGKLELESHQGETISSVSVQSVCHSQIHLRTHIARNGYAICYAGTSLGDQHSVPLLHDQFLLLEKWRDFNALFVLKMVTWNLEVVRPCHVDIAQALLASVRTERLISEV